MATELATGYVSLVTDTSQIPGQLARAFGQGGQQAGRQGGQAAAGGILDSLKGKGGMVGEVLGAAFAVAGVSAAGLFVKSLQKGMEREKILDLNQARLGVDDATMNKIGFAAGRAYAGSFGESVDANIDTARRAIQSGLLDPNATAQDTQKVISQLSGISAIMGEEIPAVSRAASQAIKTGIAKDAAGAFDLFAAAERNGLNVSEDFLDTIDEYGTQFRKLGLDGPEAFGLINQAVKGGARDVDTAADALKEFSIRVIDGSKSTDDAFESLHMNADEMASAFAKGGESAKGATDQVLKALKGIDDPLERSRIGVELFGTKWEDLGAAVNAFDLTKAADSLGQVAGAANGAIDTMTAGAATSIEGAKRSIELSTDAISGALAKAFGPELAKLADWVTNNQPAILDFLAKLVDSAFAVGDAFLGFTSSTLRNFASFVDGMTPLIQSVVQPLGKVTELFGKVTRDKDLEQMGKSVAGLGDKFAGAADGARALADGIDNRARPALDGLRTKVGENIQTTIASNQMFTALGDTVASLPDGHTITLKDNTPETTARLEALGLRVTTLPDGSVTVTANTAEGQRIMDAFIATNTGRPIEFIGKVTQLDMSGAVTNDPALQTVHVPGGRYADGGLFRGIGGPRDDRNLVAMSDKEFIVNAAATDKNLPLLDAINNGWVPPASLLHGMAPGFANGGLVAGKAFAQSMDPATYEMGGFSKGSIDCSGLVSAVINDAVGLGPFSGRMSTKSEGEWLAAKGALSGPGGPGDISVGWFDHGGGANGHTALTLGDGTNVESNGSEGVVIGGKVGADDPMFDHKMHIPAAALRGGDLGGGASGTAGGAAGGGLGGSNANGGTFGGADVPAGVTPVWVINMASTGLTPSSDIAPLVGTASIDSAPSASFEPLAAQSPSSGGSTPWYMAATPEAAFANLAAQAGEQAAKTGEGFGDLVQNNGKDFLGTLAAVVGMGALGGGGGSTFNIQAPNPNTAASAVERVIRRKTMADSRRGGFAR